MYVDSIVGDQTSDHRHQVVVLATGFNDVRPEPPLPRTGRGLHYCLHCDAHMFVDQSVYVMGHNQLPIAFGEGAKAGISAHFQLRDFPRDPELLEEQGPVGSEEVPGIPDELLEQAVDFHTYD